MPKLCAAPGCRNRSSLQSMPFHRFPLHRKELLTKWLKNLPEDFCATTTSYLCGDHFLPDMYVATTSDGRSCLKIDSFPTEFKTSSSLASADGETEPPVKIQRRCDTEVHGYAVRSPMKTVRAQQATIGKLRRRIHTLQMAINRRNSKIRKLSDALDECRRRNLLSEEAHASLTTTFHPVTQELLHNESKNRHRRAPGHRFSDTVKAFALTTYYYSPRAYNYLRSIFCLPSVSSIRDYNSSVDASPGFCSTVFDYMKSNLSKKPCENECCLVLDGMSIRQESCWDSNGGRFVGHVDYGGEMGDCDKLASEALVFMAVGLSGRWKMPCAFFFTSHMNAEQQTNFVLDCIRRLYESGIIVRAVTCDGTEVNLKMFRNFGVTLDKTSFQHPCDSTLSVYAVCDVCHMLKLVRNAFADLKVLRDGENKEIKWSFIQHLLEVQESTGIRAANKLNVNHVNFHRHKMKVKLAAQVLSKSVADALDFLCQECEEWKQMGNEATVQFIRVIDHLFDLLNCHSPFGKGSKSPLRLSNMGCWKAQLEAFRDYLLLMKSGDGCPILDHRRRTGFFGLILSINSVLSLASDLLSRHVMPFKYFLTYKLSQDHLELFFSKIRLRGGFNNNPSVLHFKAAFRSLVLKNCIAPSLAANCMALEDDDGYIAIRRKSRAPVVGDVDVSRDEVVVQMYVDAFSQSKFVGNCLYYICGFVCRSVAQHLSCEDCIAALHEGILDAPDTAVCGLVKQKDRGGLKYSSNSVYKIVSFTETVVSREIICMSKLPNMQNLRLIIQCKVIDMLATGHSLFPLFDGHFRDAVFVTGQSHYLQLIKLVVAKYVDIRLKDYGKRYLQKKHFGNKVSSRMHLNKLLLFQGR